MIIIGDLANEIYQILRSYGKNLEMYDKDGNAVYEPDEARRIFVNPDSWLVSITEDNDNSSVRFYIGKKTNPISIIDLINTMRLSATKYNMLFNVRKMNKELKKQDFASKASVKESPDMIKDTLLEGLYGTSKSSYLKLENARMIVRHSARVNENAIGARGRNIQAIFIENADLERFKFPTNNLAPARAMTQHINQGGNYADQVGEQIRRIATDYANIGHALQHLRVYGDRLSESDLRSDLKECAKTMKKSFLRLSEDRYYLSECDRLNSRVSMLVENPEDMLIELRGKFSGESIPELDNSIFESVATVLNEWKNVTVIEKEEPEMISVLGKPVSKEAWTNFVHGEMQMYKPVALNPSQTFTSKAAEIRFLLQEIVPMLSDDSLANLLGYVSDHFEIEKSPERRKKLYMIARMAIKNAGMNVSEEHHMLPECSYEPDELASQNDVFKRFDEYMNSFNSNGMKEPISELTHDDLSTLESIMTRLQNCLSDRDEMHPDQLRQICLDCVDGLGSHIGAMNSQTDTSDIVNHLGNLSEYIKSTHVDPRFFDTVSTEVSHLIGEIEKIDDGNISEDLNENESDEAIIDSIISEFNVDDFLDKMGSDFDWENFANGGEGLDVADRTYTKKYIVASLEGYLNNLIHSETGHEYDLSDTASELFDKFLKDRLYKQGYVIAEDEEQLDEFNQTELSNLDQVMTKIQNLLMDYSEIEPDLLKSELINSLSYICELIITADNSEPELDPEMQQMNNPSEDVLGMELSQLISYIEQSDVSPEFIQNISMELQSLIFKLEALNGGIVDESDELCDFDVKDGQDEITIPTNMGKTLFAQTASPGGKHSLADPKAPGYNNDEYRNRTKILKGVHGK